MVLTSPRALKLAEKLNVALEAAELRAPSLGQSERSYTSQSLVPVVKTVLADLPGLNLKLRGDGSSEQAIPAQILGEQFFPDLAVSIGSQHVWAAEVKFLRADSRQNSIATAVGQATLYRSRYQHTAVILIEVDRSNLTSVMELGLLQETVSSKIILRRVLGGMLLSGS